VNYYDNPLVVTITVACYLWAPTSGYYLFTCGATSRPPHQTDEMSGGINIAQLCTVYVYHNQVQKLFEKGHGGLD